ETEAGNIKRMFEVRAAGIEDSPGQLRLVGKGDSVNQKINRWPALGQRLKRRIKGGIVGHVDIDHEIRSDAGRQRLQPFAKGLALMAERQLGTRSMHGTGDSPSD